MLRLHQMRTGHRSNIGCLSRRCGAEAKKENPLNSLKEKQLTPDVLVANAGTLFTFNPLTARAKEWIEEHVQADAQWFGTTLVVRTSLCVGAGAGHERRWAGFRIGRVDEEAKGSQIHRRTGRAGLTRSRCPEALRMTTNP